MLVTGGALTDLFQPGHAPLQQQGQELLYAFKEDHPSGFAKGRSFISSLVSTS